MEQTEVCEDEKGLMNQPHNTIGLRETLQTNVLDTAQPTLDEIVEYETMLSKYFVFNEVERNYTKALLKKRSPNACCRRCIAR